MKLTKQVERIVNRYLKRSNEFAGGIIDIRAFKAIDFLSETLARQGQPFSILDLGCSGGPTNAWIRNWDKYNWVGIDAEARAIEKLDSILPKKSRLMLGYIHSSKFCNHEIPADESQIEIESLFELNFFDFVKIDIDGCDLHILEGILSSARSESILGIEIEVTYSTYRNSEINFARCATLLIEKGFEPMAIESARRYPSKLFSSPYVWNIDAQTAMGRVFQGNQTWVKSNVADATRAKVATSLILAAYGLSDWAWECLGSFLEGNGGEYQGISEANLRNYFLPSFLDMDSSDEYESSLDSNYLYSDDFKFWRAQAQNRELEQPWFLSN
jgi:hypothetical protein